jgi:uncharacterized protein YicC (UPF0701 family)
MPLRRGHADEDGLSWYTVHSSDEEREAVEAVVDTFVRETLRRATEVAKAEGVQLAELLNETSDRLADEVARFIRNEPISPEE